MKTRISFHNLEKAAQEALEGMIDDLARRHVEHYLASFPSNVAELQIHVDKSRHRNFYRVSETLAVPGTTLQGQDEGYDLMGVVRKSLDQLERELLRHIARLRQDDSWRRKEHRERLRRLKTVIEAKPETGVKPFGDMVRDLLPKLQQFVRRELAALRAGGDLNPGYPSPDDVVDEVLARAWERLEQRPRDLETLQWLYQLTHAVLDEAVRDYARATGRSIPAGSRPPQRRDYTLDELTQGVREFWQPDEMLKREDVTPVTGETPEQIVGDAELRRYFHDALARMPNNWRRAIWLTQAEATPLPKVARMMGTSEKEAKRWIRRGDEYLRARLREAGYRPVDEGKLPAYFMPTPAAAAAELAQALDEVTQGAT